MKQPEDVHLSREEGEALLARLEANTLTAEDRRVLGEGADLLLLAAVCVTGSEAESQAGKGAGVWREAQEARAAVVGRDAQRRECWWNWREDGSITGSAAAAAPESTEEKPRPPGHGRQGADVYRAAQTVACRHEELAVGERCPACGRGRLYRLPPGVEMRLDGNALLSAVRYELEKLRCSACGQIFTASVPAEAGAEKYSARARAVLALARYYLGVPWYRLESFQALVGVPVPDATQWDQVELVGDCAYPIFKYLERLAAQGEVIYQDDTPGRILALIEENQKAAAQAQATGDAPARTGM